MGSPNLRARPSRTPRPIVVGEVEALAKATAILQAAQCAFPVEAVEVDHGIMTTSLWVGALSLLELTLVHRLRDDRKFKNNVGKQDSATDG